MIGAVSVSPFSEPNPSQLCRAHQEEELYVSYFLLSSARSVAGLPTSRRPLQRLFTRRRIVSARSSKPSGDSAWIGCFNAKSTVSSSAKERRRRGGGSLLTCTSLKVELRAQDRIGP